METTHNLSAEDAKIFKNEVKKDLYKTKADAEFLHYRKGNLYYTVAVLGVLYKFPISVIDSPIACCEVGKLAKVHQLSSDLGDTPFDAKIPGRLLIRWIEKAIDVNKFDFIKKID